MVLHAQHKQEPGKVHPTAFAHEKPQAHLYASAKLPLQAVTAVKPYPILSPGPPASCGHPVIEPSTRGQEVEARQRLEGDG